MLRLSVRELFFMVAICALAIALFNRSIAIQKLQEAELDSSIRLEILSNRNSLLKADLRDFERQWTSERNQYNFQNRLTLNGACQLAEGKFNSAAESFAMLNNFMPRNVELLKLNWLINETLGKTQIAKKFKREFKIVNAEKATGLKYQR